MNRLNPPVPLVGLPKPIDRIILGLWPLAGISTGKVSQEDALATIQMALDVGIRTFDTAFSYGYDGICDQLLGQSIRNRVEDVVVIGKVGQRWTNSQKRVVDGHPRQLTADAEQSLCRLGIQRFDLLMLHSPDPNVEIERSAEALEQLVCRGLARTVGICNANEEQIRRFAGVVETSAIQTPLNILQRESLANPISWCQENSVGVLVYWTLMKGILAGRIEPDHVFSTGDSRPSYTLYQGELRRQTHQRVDRLKQVGLEMGKTVAQLVIGWALSQPAVSAALVGAKHPQQISETAFATPFPPEGILRIEEACCGDSSLSQ